MKHGTISCYTNARCRCDLCAEAKRQYGLRWKAANPTYHREKHLRKKYGLSANDYDRMLAAQGGTCAVCGSAEPGRADHRHLHVDHDHATGEVRGLLCDFCNKGLGQFFDDPGRLRAAADYLERTREVSR